MAPVYLFHGDDAFALAAARQKLEAQVLDPAWKDFNLTALGPEASAGQAVAAAMTIPFGMGNRLVVVKDAPYLAGKTEDPGVADLEAMLEKGVPENAHLLFLSPKADSRLKLVKAIQAKGRTQEFGAANPFKLVEQLSEFVRGLAGERQRRIAPDAAATLIELTKGDKYRIQREIEKLAVAAPEGQPITVDLVRELVAGGDGEVFAITEAIARRDVGAAWVAFGRLPSNEHLLKSLAAVVSIMRNWAKMKGLQEQGLRPDAIAQALKAHPFKIGKDLEALRGWKAAQLEAALDQLLEVDLGIKEGRWPPDAHRTLFERAIAKMLG